MKPSIIVTAVLAVLTLPAGAGTLDDARSRGGQVDDGDRHNVRV